jgi:large subunit ribosomal protein L22
MAETQTSTKKKERRAPPAPRSRPNRPARPAAGPHASLSYLRMAPRKVRLVTDLIRGRAVEEALNILTFTPKAAARPLAKLLRSAVANADVKGGVDLDKLVVREAFVNEGPTWRRWLSRAMGRATRVRKRTSHVTLVLGQE